MDAVTASLLKEAGVAPPAVRAGKPDWAAETAAGRAQQPERDALSRAVLTAEGGVDPAARSGLSQEQWSARIGGAQAEPDPVTKALLAEASGKLSVPAVAAKQEPKAAPLVDSTGVRETAAHVVTGIGSGILGGYHGLAALASGGTLDDAVKAVEDAQKRGTYQPESAGGKLGAAAMASPLNPLNWLGMFGKKVGETMQDFGVGPLAATGAEVLVNAAPAALLAKGKVPAAATSTIGDVAANRTVTPAPASTAALEVTPNLDVPTVIRRKQAAASASATPISEVGKSPAAAKSQPMSDSSGKWTEAEAIKNGYTVRAFRGVDLDNPFNKETGTVWATTNKNVAQAYARDVWGYDNPGVIEVRIKPGDIPKYDMRKISPAEQERLAGGDRSGQPQSVGIYLNSDDSPLGGSYPHTALHVPAANVWVPNKGVVGQHASVGAAGVNVAVPVAEAPSATVAQVAAGQPALPAPASTPAPAPKAQTPTQAALSAQPAVTTITGAEAAERAAVLKRIGLEDARRSAIAGDAKQAATDYQTSRLDSPGGNVMRSQLERERQALTEHGERIVQETGGTLGMDQKTLMARGETIIRPLDALKKWFDTQTSKLYVDADARAKGVPTPMSEFRALLDDSSMLTNSDRVHLQSATNAYLKKLGVVGEDGSINATAAQAETVRKYLNEQWSPQNNKLVGALKDALDNDVLKAAGEDIYAKARAMRTMRGATLDNPNGIAKLMDSSGPEGINRAVQVERIPDTVAAMPVEQLRHIIRTLDSMPPELQAQAAAAKAEIKAHFANDLLAEGNKNAVQWNAKNVRAYLDANAAKFEMLFNDAAELARINDLRQAGNILHKEASYPGAAVQQHNLVRSGVMGALRSGGAAAGAAIGGPPGAALGGLVGENMAQRFSGKQSLRSAEKRMIRLDEVKP